MIDHLEITYGLPSLSEPDQISLAWVQIFEMVTLSLGASILKIHWLLKKSLPPVIMIS